MNGYSRREPPQTPDLGGAEWRSIDPREVLAYDADTETYRALFDSEKETIGEAILSIVAAVSGTDPLELPSLHSVLDTEAVDRVIESWATGSSTGDLHVSFTFADCDVTVHSYGLIAVHPLHEDSTA